MEVKSKELDALLGDENEVNEIQAALAAVINLIHLEASGKYRKFQPLYKRIAHYEKKYKEEGIPMLGSAGTMGIIPKVGHLNKLRGEISNLGYASISKHFYPALASVVKDKTKEELQELIGFLSNDKSQGNRLVSIGPWKEEEPEQVVGKQPFSQIQTADEKAQEKERIKARDARYRKQGMEPPRIFGDPKSDDDITDDEKYDLDGAEIPEISLTTKVPTVIGDTVTPNGGGVDGKYKDEILQPDDIPEEAI